MGVGGVLSTITEACIRENRFRPEVFTSMITSDGYYDDNLTLLQATDFLRQLLHEFPFSEKKPMPQSDDTPEHFFQSRSLAVQVAAMLSQFAIGCLPRHSLRLGFIYNANTERSGKTLLAKLAIVAVSGKMAAQSWTKKDEDLRKAIDAEVLRASRYIVFDNVKGHIQSQILEAFMTSSNWTGRVLGKTQMFEAENTATLFFTGNDCTVSPDMSNRCLIVDLYVDEADVQARAIESPINDSWLMQKENRFKILSALWAIVRYWDHAGRPKPTGRVRVGFEEWCVVIAGMVEFAGFGDCLAEPDIEKDPNTEQGDTKALVKLLMMPDAGEPQATHLEFTFQEIVNAAHEAGLFGWVLDGKEDKGNYDLNHKSESSFGKLLRKFAPLIGQRRFRFDGKVVLFRCTGKNRQRRYVLDLVS